MQVDCNIKYRDAVGYDPALVSLDIYYEQLKPKDEKRPIIVFIHGGGWDGGDKACFPEASATSMPSRFVELGYVFVSVNHRLADNLASPGAGIDEMVSDVAKALKWLSINGRRFGGRNTGFVLIGHSSGAHLAMLVATHRRYLSLHRLTPDACSAVIALDVPHFDVPMTMRILETRDTGLPNQDQRLASLYRLFGAEQSEQEAVSPASQLGPWLDRTAFLIVSVGLQRGYRQWLTKRMGEHFKRRLDDHGIQARHIHLDDWEHAELVEHFDGRLAAEIEDFIASLPRPAV